MDFRKQSQDLYWSRLRCMDFKQLFNCHRTNIIAMNLHGKLQSYIQEDGLNKTDKENKNSEHQIEQKKCYSFRIPKKSHLPNKQDNIIRKVKSFQQISPEENHPDHSKVKITQSFINQCKQKENQKNSKTDLFVSRNEQNQMEIQSEEYLPDDPEAMTSNKIESKSTIPSDKIKLSLLRKNKLAGPNNVLICSEIDAQGQENQSNEGSLWCGYFKCCNARK